MFFGTRRLKKGDDQLLILKYGVFGMKRRVSLAGERRRAKLNLINQFKQETRNSLSTPKHNLQRLHKIQSQFKLKTRKRKFKSRTTNGWRVRESARFASRPRRFLFRGFRTKRACRLTFKALIGAEKAIMATKSKVWVRYRKYPNFFVTRKSSKSRMGKGKGKIAGRVAKVRRGEVIFEGKIASQRKTRKWVGALKLTMPSKLRLVYHSAAAEKLIKNFYRSRPWYAAIKKYKKKKRHLIQKKKFIEYYDYHDEVLESSYRYHRIFCTWKELDELKNAKAIFRRFWKRVASRPYRRPYVNIRGVEKVSGIDSGVFKRATFLPGLGGSWRRNFIGKRSALREHIKEIFAAYHAPDEDGYYGMYREANWRIKRGIEREKYTRRSGLAPSWEVF